MAGDSATPTPPRQSFALETRVVLPESDVFPGWTPHVTARRAEVILEGERSPTFTGPQLVSLVFRARSGGELAAVARWVKREIDPTGARRLVCLLVDPVEDRARPGEAAEGRRRGAYRVQPATLGDVPVSIRPFVDPRRSWAEQLADLRTRGPRDVVHGSLADISLGGAGIRVGKDDRWPYAYAQLVMVSIAFPGRLEPLYVPASILRRIDAESGVLYGVSFAPVEACPFEPVEREILAYVMGRQRQQLRHRAG